MVSCKDGTFYTGYTNHLFKRILAHNQKKGAKYTKTRVPVAVSYVEVFLDKSSALSREYALKQLTRGQKIKLIQGFQFCLTNFVLFEQDTKN